MSVPNQGHFYCTPCFLGVSWLIYERSSKKNGIKGGCVYSAKSRYFAYKLRNVLEEMYRLGAYDALARWRSVFGGCHPADFECYLEALESARKLLSEFRPDDSRVIYAPVVGLPSGGV